MEDNDQIRQCKQSKQSFIDNTFILAVVLFIATNSIFIMFEVKQNGYLLKSIRENQDKILEVEIQNRENQVEFLKALIDHRKATEMDD